MKNMKLMLPVILGLTATNAIAADDVKLRLIGTADVHGYISDFDYYANQKSKKYGLVGLVAEIEKYRSEAKNAVLADAGDLLSGNPHGDYLAKTTSVENDTRAPIMCAVNSLNYDVAVPGNHEFDNGLEYLNFNYDKGNFPTILSNVYHAGTKNPYFKPYVIIPKTVVSETGESYTLNIGYIGITPVQTMDLNKKWLEGKIDIVDPLPEAIWWTMEARDKGADIVIALSHSGLKDDEYIEGMEDMTWHLAHEAGVDAILFGHTHKVFPSKKYAKTKNVDLEKGTVHGVPASQAGKWGDHLSVIDLDLTYDNGWTVKGGTGYAVPSSEIAETPQQLAKINQCIEADHAKIVAEFDKTVGKTDTDLSNDFNLLANDTVYQIVGDSQLAYAKNHIETDLPILTSAPVAVHRNDPMHFVSIAKGDVNMRDVGAMVYSSTLAAKEISGAEIKEWLEISASMYAEPDADYEAIIKPDHLTFLYYTIPNLEYKIDLTKPSTHNSFGFKVDDGEGRVQDIRYQGKLIQDDDRFVIIASSYNPFFAKKMKAGEAFIDIGNPNARDVLKDYMAGTFGAPETKVKNSWSLVLDENKSYTYTVKNNAEALPAFKSFSGFDIALESQSGSKNVYRIK
ncbi:metallophosphoesterase [Pseudovibrio sp. FO-BEG1]|uniref:metallophosphoesterase n=1 Tax=Pseudovibrio sp. (strain FO-BEG1) TaxID=911045 RepID=UPI0013053BF0|nr:metallophosphoesterase [Pseudovibrio sp. FO-BEG1]